MGVESIGLPQQSVRTRISSLSGTGLLTYETFISGQTVERVVFVAPVDAEIKKITVTLESGHAVLSERGDSCGYRSYEILNKGSAGSQNLTIARIDNNVSSSSGVVLKKLVPHDFVSGTTGGILQSGALVNKDEAVTCKIVSKVMSADTLVPEAANIDVFWVPQAGLKRIR